MASLPCMPAYMGTIDFLHELSLACREEFEEMQARRFTQFALTTLRASVRARVLPVPA
jgi:hypothetical protein